MQEDKHIQNQNFHKPAKTLIWLLGLVCLLLATGCRTQEPTQAEPTATARIAVAPPTPSALSPTQVSTAGITPTQFPTLMVTATLTPTTPVENLSEMGITQYCLDIMPPELAKIQAQGVLVYEDDRDAIVFRDMETGQLTQVDTPESPFSYELISPDKSRLAYVFDDDVIGDPGLPNEIFITTSKGQQLQTLPWHADWTEISGWSINQQLLILAERPGQDEFGRPLWPTQHVVLDLISGNQQQLWQDFPDFFDPTIERPLLQNWYGVSCDPTLTRAVYLRYITPDKSEFTYALWDVPNDKLIATFEAIYTNYTELFQSNVSEPRWSADGEFFILEGGVKPDTDGAFREVELFRISRDGDIEQLTHLFPYVLLGETRYSLSPDGSKLAMVMNIWGKSEDRIAVMDLETMEVIDYCIPVQTVIQPWVYWGNIEPLWSPDSTQFLFIDDIEQDGFRVVLVDIERDFAAQISENLYLIGWMTAKP